MRFEKAGKSVTWIVKEPVVHHSLFNFVCQEGSHCALEEFRVLKLEEGVEFMGTEIRVSFFSLQLAVGWPFEHGVYELLLFLIKSRTCIKVLLDAPDLL